VTERKDPSVCTLFVARMKHEGRHDEWKQTLVDVQAETGQGFGQARWEAMRRMGYVGPDDERQKHASLITGQQIKQVTVQNGVPDGIGEVPGAITFEDALNELPTEADPRVEIAWIRNHPAMARKARSSDSAQPVIISAADILNPSHGGAPSRAAAIQLQNWAENPTEFNKQFAGLVKKTDGGDTGKDLDIVVDDGLDEVRRLLKEVVGEPCPRCGGYRCCAQLAQGGADYERATA
jgi:hypothetical protein